MITPQEQPPRRRGRASLVVGVALLATGAILLGWVGWQYFGTNWVSHRHQREVVDRLEQRWAAGSDLARTEHGTAQSVIRIPRFGDDYAVPVLEGTSDEVLASGFGHFTGSTDPGDVGNYAVAAHRVTHGEPLRGMPDLEAGDRVLVETRDTVYTYELTTGGDDLTVPLTSVWVLAPDPKNPDGGVQPPQGDEERLLTLTTCSELFHTDDRLVAFGVLVDTAPRT